MRNTGKRAAVLLASVLAVATTGAASSRATVTAIGAPALAGPGQFLRPPDLTRVPKSGSSGLLTGIYCTSAADCWAVGYYRARQALLNEVLHWDGRTWGKVKVPNPGGIAISDSNQLFSIRCAAARDCWAVGTYDKHGAALNQALHWNGRSWSLVATPTPGGTLRSDLNEIYDVTCLSPASCWAAGIYGTSGSSTTQEVLLNELLRWDGRKWSRVAAPNPAGAHANHINIPNAIRCASADSCLVVGESGVVTGPPTLRNEALRWNGRTWSLVATPQPGGTGAAGDVSELFGLTCASPTSCWAVGNYGSFQSPLTSLNEILHWNGRRWSQTTAPNPDGTGAGAYNTLYGDFCSSAGNCWAVGTYGSIQGGTGVVLNQALHWNGTKWSQVTTPEPGGSGNEDQDELFAIRCASRADCWAVGFQQQRGGQEQNQALHWNGARWSVR